MITIKRYLATLHYVTQLMKINFVKNLLFTFSTLVLFTFYSEESFSQQSVSVVRDQSKAALARSTPEAEGVSSESIINFLDAARESNTEFHSIMVLRHGKVIAEGWWAPYAPDLKHTMYSCSKSFTATAIGFAVSENRLTVNDKVISFFPNDLPDTVSAYLAELTVKDMLSMSVGHEKDPTAIRVSTDSNWVRAFLAVPILYKPGTKFLYNSLATYMLSAIVQKLTGQKVVDYLRPRLFEPLGIEGMDWEVDPRGINTGGWGLRIKTEDMAKFGQLFLQKGKWNGKQILPEAWVNEASTLKIVQHPEYSQAKRDSSDWEQGYCYQMWRCRHNAYRGDGAFGQFIIVMPDRDAVIAITAETSSMQEEINLVWKYLLPSMTNDKLPVNKTMAANLQQKLSLLAVPLPVNTITPAEAKIFNKTFLLEPNEKNIQSLSFNCGDNKCELKLEAGNIVYQFAFGKSRWQMGETTRRGPYLVAAAKASYVGLPPLKLAGAYSWKDDQTMELTLRYIESPHTEKMICHVDGNNITIDIENSFDYGKKKLQLKGVVKE
ncbi:MAG: serine hydrolase domain-containing protein [Chitinophagaceae bacterium]